LIGKWELAKPKRLLMKGISMSDIDLKASELVLELEKMGLYGLGYFAGLLVERKPNMAEQLRIAIKLNQEEMKS
jgi:hypothetical protein